MAIQIDHDQARNALAAALTEAELAFAAGKPLCAPVEIAALTERLFTSATQAYREALLGCAVARYLDQNINIRHPATETSDDAFSGRVLSEKVVTPFLQGNAIPVSKAPYLSALRGGARFVRGGEPRFQRDIEGFNALADIVEYLSTAEHHNIEQFIVTLLYRFVLLREASRIGLRRTAKPNLRQLSHLIDGLLSTRSGGRFPALLATAMFRTIAECHGLGWNIEFQGINVADAATGAVGDITIRKGDLVVLGIEVTERQIDRARITATFEHKIAPNALSDYLFVTTVEPRADALAAAYNYTAVGHEMNFVDVRTWLVNNLASIGPECRAVFQAQMILLLEAQKSDLKVIWNERMDHAIGSHSG